MNKPYRGPAVLLLALVVGGCGGAGGTPTALPPDVARPAQPGPVFDNPVQDFRLTPIPEPAPTVVAPAAATAIPLLERPTVVAPLAQTPTALAVTTVQSALLTDPNGSGLRDLPTGTTLTITGRSADGAWLAGYTEDGIAGWVAASSVTLFGGADLQTVDHSVAPDAIATLIAQAMLPVELPTGLTAPPAGTHRTGVVLPADGLIVRQSPQADAPVIGHADANETVPVLGRSQDSAWLVVVVDQTVGWTAAAALQLDGGAPALPVVQP